MPIKLQKLLKSFTLIELIIVIAIIAVLGATAFLLLTQWMSKGRDAQRISDLNVIQNALNIQITQADSLPIPDDYNTVTYTGEIVLYQGKFGSGVVSKISSLTKLPKDRTNGEYEYSLLSDRLTYKIQAIMENNNYKTSFVQGVFADELYYRYVGKDLRGIIVGNDFVYLPNMFLTGYVNGEYDLGSGMNVFLGNKVGEYVSGGIVDKDYKDGIIAMMTGLGLRINDATSILSKATGVASTTITEQQAQPEDTSWCYYSSNELSNSHADWNSTELKYDSANNKCYVFGDEDDNAKAACNKWVSDNITQWGEFVWVPARWFVTDGIGTNMKDAFYQREINYNGKDYVCRGFAIAKYEMALERDLNTSELNSTELRNTWTGSVASRGIGNVWQDGPIVSLSGKYPITRITQPQAIAACESIGGHLITNNEWMTTARNIEKNPVNWSGGVVGINNIYNGLSNGALGCVGMSKTIYPLIPNNRATKTGNGGNTDCDNRRQLEISNGQKIWDLAGNVWEHVNKANTIDSNDYNSNTLRISNACGTEARFSFHGNDLFPQCDYQNGYTYLNLGPDMPSLNSNNGIGRIFSSNKSNIVFIRGGHSNDSLNSGLYTISLSAINTTASQSLGFRCTR
ncbi:MAG: prepilin-type N-terminal cleavage/methylation domain-containing protein [Candidatus Absconditabacteria bacterium]